MEAQTEAHATELQRMRPFMDRVNTIFAQAMSNDIRQNQPERYFPAGLRYRYFRAGKSDKSRELWFCWSLTKNANGKYASWIYKWCGKKGRVGEWIKLREFRHKNRAKARALKLYNRRVQRLAKAVTTT